VQFSLSYRYQIDVSAWLHGEIGVPGWKCKRDSVNRNVCTEDTQRAVDNFIAPSHLEVLCPAPGASTSRWIPHGKDTKGLTTYRACEGTTITEAANGMLEKVLSAPNGYTPQRAHLLLLHGVVRGNVKKMVMNCEEYDNVGHSQVIKAKGLCVHM